MESLRASLEMWWQSIPQNLNPIALTLGGLPVYWYALFFLAGSALVYLLAGKQYQEQGIFTKAQYTDFGFGVFVSAVFGGKLGFLLLYWWPFTPQDLIPTVGASTLALPGMSFVGGTIVVAFFILWFTRKHQKEFFALTDILVIYIPVAIFFGRLGNFFQNELWGRVTTVSWGMYFPGMNMLRHPSSLYAAFLEGIVLFSILLFLRKQNARGELRGGMITVWFCILYGALRFLSEYFREPDRQIGYLGIFTLNQFFAAGFFLFGIIFLSVKKRKNKVY